MHENIFVMHKHCTVHELSNIFLAQFMYWADILHSSWTGQFHRLGVTYTAFFFFFFFGGGGT